MGILRTLAPYVLRYTGLYAAVAVGAAYAGSLAAGYSFGKAALGLALFGIIVGPLLFATSQVGLESAEAGGEVGFQGITDPRDMQPESLSFPGKSEVGLFLLGLSLWGLLGLAFLAG